MTTESRRPAFDFRRDLPALAERFVLAPLRAWRERQRLIAEMSEADDRILAELGVSRSEIDAVADGSYRGHLETRRAPAFVPAAPRSGGERRRAWGHASPQTG